MKTLSEIEMRDALKALDERVHRIESVFLFLFGAAALPAGIGIAFLSLSSVLFEANYWAIIGQLLVEGIGLVIAWLGFYCMKEAVS
jgi:hypothetical protein